MTWFERGGTSMTVISGQLEESPPDGDLSRLWGDRDGVRGGGPSRAAEGTATAGFDLVPVAAK